jgi:hypothetical protein
MKVHQHKSNVQRKSNVVHLHRDRGYRWTDRDPAMEELCDIIDKSGLSIAQIVEKVYDATNGVYSVSNSTIAKWLDGTTRRPSNFCLTWVGYALGVQRKWTPLD